MLTRAGSGSAATVKLLDFGLAKSSVFPQASAAVAQTMTTPLTGQGTIVGTLQYMAPEQLEGRDVDARTDIFALGSILYEMLTGTRAFQAASQAGVMAAILEKEPPAVSAAQPLTPPGLDRIVQRCLAKDPDARWQSASDLAAALSWLRTDSGASTAPAVARPARAGRIVAAIAGAFVLTVALIATIAVLNRGTERPRTIHAAIPAPFAVAVPEISPDGSMIVWSGSSLDSGLQPLWLQPLDSEAGRAIPGTEGATYAFWSPDGRSIGFFADQKLKRVAVSGGAATTICDIPDADPRGGTWGPGDTIVVSGARIGALSRGSAAGGTPQPLTTLDKAIGHTTHRWPRFLPDGRHFLFFASRNVVADSEDMIMIASIDGEPPRLVRRARSNPAVASGRLLFADSGRLVSQPFDPVTGSVSGEPVPVLDDVYVGYGVTRAMFAVMGSILVASPMVASPADTDSQRFTVQWVAADGATKTAIEDTDYDSHVRLSPDGRRLAVSIQDLRSHHSDIWIIDATTGSRTRLTFKDDSFSPVWSRDGGKVYYLTVLPGGGQLMAKTLGGDETLAARNVPAGSELQDCSRDYCLLAIWRPAAGTNYDLLRVRLADGAIEPAVATAADENDGRLSPDGTLLAYALQEGGLENIFVQTFPAGSGKWQVTTAGGHAPFWSRDGRTLYFLTNDLVVGGEVSTRGGFSIGEPVTIARRRPTGSPAAPPLRYADIAADGRVLAEVPRAPTSVTPYRLVLNWNR
jgi:Tol biopolymer transport system component